MENRITAAEVEHVADELEEYVPGLMLDKWKPSPDCLSRFRMVRNGEVVLGANWWLGRKEAYLHLWTALNIIREYIKATKEDKDV